MALLLGCSSKETSSTATNGRVSPTYGGPPESAYCANATTFGAPTVTITGTAKFIRRRIYDNPPANITYEGLGSASTSHATLPAEERPIRAAEIRVTDPSGNVVQCGETNSANGTFSITLPQGNVNYTLSINSRAYNQYLRASVLNRPEANQFYSLSTTVNASASANVGTLRATADSSGAILGAAFNILDDLFTANDYLRTKAGAATCGAIAGCRSVTLASPIPKVTAYWEKGFNPNSYFGSSSGLSFYLPGYSRLFILGGQDGDVDSSDTDHFDNSVILHEYGHFLEDSMFVSDSPGGSHNGNKIIDPRLAWSEGWGNFFQVAVLSWAGSSEMSNPRYYDSSGNLDGDPQLFFEVDLENAVAGQDLPTAQGEGNFREFSVTRILFDVLDNTPAEGPAAAFPGGSDNVTDKFHEIWAALTKTTDGFNDSSWAFRNIGSLHLGQQALPAPTNWSAIRTGNFQDGDNRQYAQYVTTSGTCANLGGYRYQINPTNIATSLSTSNLFAENDFYHLKISAAGTYTIQLVYKDADGADSNEDGNGATSATVADLDLYLYSEDYTFGSSSGLVGRSFSDPDNNFATQKSETITVSLQPGNYLINVNAYTGDGYHKAENTYYSIKLGGSDLCPDSL